MALIFEVEYPGGERVSAIGYPDAPLRVDVVPHGPEAWMDARDAEGWVTREAPEDPHEIWLAPDRPDLDADALICLAREFQASLRGP